MQLHRLAPLRPNILINDKPDRLGLQLVVNQPNPTLLLLSQDDHHNVVVDRKAAQDELNQIPKSNSLPILHQSDVRLI